MELIDLNENTLALNVYTRGMYCRFMDTYYNTYIEPEQVEYYDEDDFDV